MTRFFDPSKQPERDRFGFTLHPDLGLFHSAEDGINEASLQAAGYGMAFVRIEDDAPSLLDAYSHADDFALARWDPTPPGSDGWQLVALGDTETGPVAVFVKRLA